MDAFAEDSRARDKARLALDANVVVEAGAGTGKTTLLTERLLFLLLGGGVPVGSLVALTFTEKAAGEIKLRLSERLAELVAGLSGQDLAGPARSRAERLVAEAGSRFGVDEEVFFSRAEAALADLDKAAIGTIHAFAAHLLRAYPVEAGVDPGFAVDEGEGFEDLFAQEWARWLDAELGEAPPRAEAWLDVLRLAGLEDLEVLARELCRERLDLERLLGPDPGTAAWLETLAREVEGLGQDQPPPHGASRIRESLDAVAGRLKALAAAAAKADPPLPASLVEEELRPSQWPQAWDCAGRGVYERARAAAGGSSAGEEALLRRACRLLAPLARGFRRTYTRRGLVSFDGLLLKARDLVRDHADVREELKARYRAFLIDEFQDTDPLQGELLLYLAEASGESARRWQDIRLGGGRIFVVGDPKQSIYRFRGADIAAYQGFTAHILGQPGALACDLLTNFRSPARLLEPVNAVFAPLMAYAPGLQPAYKPLQAGREDSAQGPAMEIVTIASPADAGSVQRAEAAWISRWIRGHCGGQGRHAYKDMAVLLRSATPLPALLESFKREGIPYAVELERHFYGAQEVVDFVNLLRVLDDPGDRVSLAGLLRSPLGGLEDQALYRLCRSRALSYLKDPVAVLPAADRERLSRLFAILRRLRARVGREPLGDLVAAALEETGLLEVSAAAYQGEQSASNLLKFARLAAEASEGRGLTLKEFIARIEAERAQDRSEGESPLADESLDAVRVLTIHKSKGLEFPVVFLANASGARAGSGSAVSLLDWGSSLAGLRLPRARAASAAMARLESEEALRQDHESVRLLYVALTRARERLFILGKDSGERKAFSSRMAAVGAWPAEGARGMDLPGCGRRLPVHRVAAGEEAREEAPPARASGRKAPAPSARELSRRWEERLRRRDEAAAASWSLSPTRLAGEPDKPGGPQEGRLAADFPRDLGRGGEVQPAALGRLCHRVLQDWDFRRGGDIDAAVKAAVAALKRVLPEMPPPAWAALQAEARDMLGSFLDSPEARELDEVEILGREVPFIYEEKGAVMRGTIDLLYRQGGKVFVADYKTDRVKSGGLAKRRRLYEAQGKAYRAAVEKALGIKGVGFRLIFLKRNAVRRCATGLPPRGSPAPLGGA